MKDGPVNAMVRYLNSLRTQQEGANPTYVYETRSEFLGQLRREHPEFPKDEDLHAPTTLDGLATAIRDRTIGAHLIFLTGDAGDGKTELCAQVARALGGSGEVEDVTELGGWSIIKDASELDDTQLVSLITDRFSDSGNGGLLVAINEGRLRRLVEGQRDNELIARLWEQVIRDSLEVWMDEDAARKLDERMGVLGVLVINFRQRFHVRTTLPNLLKTWTGRELWEDSPTCRACPAAPACSILGNIASLREQATQTLMGDVLAGAHFSGQRMPFRRLQGLLAACCTGGLDCTQVQSDQWLDGTKPLERLSYRFYSALFGLGANWHRDRFGVVPEPVTRSLTAMDPGTSPYPDFDEEVETLVSAGARAMPSLGGIELPAAERAAVEQVRAEAQAEEKGSLDLGYSEMVAILTENLRRWAWLSDSGMPSALWRQALRLLEDGSGQELLRKTVSAINRIHRVTSDRSDGITRHQVDSAAFRDLARLSLELDLGEDFECEVHRGPTIPSRIKRWLEWAPCEVRLVARPRGRGDLEVALKLDTRLVECLLRVREGYVFLGALGAYRRDLGRFHSLLAGSAARAYHQPRVLIRIPGSSYAVRTRAESGRMKLTLEGR